MTSRAAAIAVSLALAACSGSSGLSGGSGKKADKPKKDESAGTTDEGEKAQPPQQVSGAFLTCGADTGSTATDADPEGCKFADKSGAKIAGAVTAPTVSVTMKDGSTIKPPATPAPDASPWHFLFNMPKGQGANASSFAATANVGGQAMAMATGESLGSTKTGTRGSTATGPASNTGPTGGYQVVFLTSLTFAPGADGGFYFSNVKTTDDACAALASNVGLNAPNWTSILTAGGHPLPADINIVAPVKNRNNEIVANNANDFWSGNHSAAMNYDENGTLVPNALAWTGSDPVGNPSLNCKEWGSGDPALGLLSAVDQGVIGDATAVNGTWLALRSNDCGSSPAEHRFHIYCISN